MGVLPAIMLPRSEMVPCHATESFHLASAFELLAGEECELDFLDPEMSLQERKEFRHLVIDIVMATDLQQHFTILQRFRQLVVPDTGVLPSSGLSAEARSITLQMAMKCCDLGHLAKSRPTHVRWTKAIEEEFFLQGDEERHLGLPVSPFMDRFNANLAKSQVGFFQFVGLPLWNAFTTVFKEFAPILEQCQANNNYWQQLLLMNPQSP
eukprot:jgi/Mesvir1/7601/Mv08642-RA.1